MIDKRTKTDFSFIERDDRLDKLSDTDIVLEFSKLLTSIYPHLVKVYANSYDPYDDIAEGLFSNFVYQTFASKYGKVISYAETHRYGFNLHCFHKIHHIQINPKYLPLKVVNNEETIFLTADRLKGKELVFIQLGDPVNNLTGGDDFVNIETVNFNYSEVALVDKLTGLRFRNNKDWWVENSSIEFELVLEDYDKEEHQYYKENLFAD
jgi:hypothetical protein